MNKLVTTQTLIFLTSIQIGILMGVLFDSIRIFRKIIRHPDFLVQLEDMLFWVFCAFIGFYILYICNYAEIRPFVFIGMLLGSILYFLTFSRVFMKIAILVIDYVKKWVRIVIRILLRPIKWLYKCIKWPIRQLILQYREIRWILKVKYHIWKYKKNEQKMDHKVDKYLKKGKA